MKKSTYYILFGLLAVLLCALFFIGRFERAQDIVGPQAVLQSVVQNKTPNIISDAASEGLAPQPEEWENGMRTDGSLGTFEDWYLDAQMDDGSVLILMFSTKPLFINYNRSLSPTVSVGIIRPDGSRVENVETFSSSLFVASTTRLSVVMGDNVFRGDLDHYSIKTKGKKGISVDLNLTRVAPSWRPGGGKIYSDSDKNNYFAWLVGVPYGTIEGMLFYDGKEHRVKGTAYHDHNWSNGSLANIFNRWYWGRLHVGEYTVIWTELFGSPEDDSRKVPVLYVAKNDSIIMGDAVPTMSVFESDEPFASKDVFYPRTIVFNARKDGVGTMKLTLTDHAIIAGDGIRGIGGLYYLRFLSPFTLKMNEEIFVGKAIHDVLNLK